MKITQVKQKFLKNQTSSFSHIKKKLVNSSTLGTKYYTENKRLSNTNPTDNRGELRCFGRVSGSCSTCYTHRVTLVRNLVISHE